MKTSKILFPFMIILMLSCDFMQHRADIVNDTFPETQSEIMSLVENILKDGAAKNLEALDAYHLNSPKFTRAEVGGLLSYEEGKKKEESFYGNSDIINYKILDHKVDVYDDMAIASFILEMTAIVTSDTLELKSMLSLTFVRDEGDWKIVHEHVGPRLE